MNLFKVNQRVWSFTKGWGTVTEITNSSTTGYDYPVKVKKIVIISYKSLKN